MSDLNEEQERFLEDLMEGRRCDECGEPITPGAPCEGCAETAAIIREVLPQLRDPA